MEAEFGSVCLFFEHLQVIDMPEHNPGQMGGTMRLGKRRTLFQTKNSVMSKSGLSPAPPSALRAQDARLGLLLGLRRARLTFLVLFLLLRSFFPPFLVTFF